MKMNKRLELVSNFSVKGISEDSDDIIIEGFANTTTKDRVGDVIIEEAWVKGGLDNYLKNPVILAYHKHDRPIGSMESYGVSNKGLHVTAKISKAAGDVYDLVKSGMLKAFSVGFMVKDADYDQETDIFVIKDLELHEISVVSVPANADSLFSLAKSFENKKEYDEFKNSFIEVDEDESTIEGDIKMPKKVDSDGNIILTPEELAAKTQEAITNALAKAKADDEAKKKADEAITTLAVEAGTTGAERLVKEVEDRFATQNAEFASALEGLQTELKSKSEEIIAMQNSKMVFNPKDDKTKATNLEIDTAIIVAKTMGKNIQDTDYYKQLVEKKGDHLANASDQWEMTYSTRMFDEIQDRLIMEPLFNNRIEMNSRSMTFPFNPEAGYASWIVDTSYKSFRDPSEEVVVAEGAGVGTADTSTGPNREHLISDITLKAEKIASKEAIGYEEEEDAIIPIIPIITAAIARRMSRTMDTELLLANAGVATYADIGLPPVGFNGVSTLATDLGTSFTQAGAFGSANPITVSDLQQTRRQMGRYGHMPSDITYIVNQDVYFDLLEDPDFRTMDLVGEKATILTGQVGSVNGSPVIVSDAFKPAAAGVVAAVALNTSNYLFGTLRGLTTERDKDVLNQKNWIVTTRRFAFDDIDATATTCSNLVYGS